MGQSENTGLQMRRTLKYKLYSNKENRCWIVVITKWLNRDGGRWMCRKKVLSIYENERLWDRVVQGIWLGYKACGQRWFLYPPYCGGRDAGYAWRSWGRIIFSDVIDKATDRTREPLRSCTLKSAFKVKDKKKKKPTWVPWDSLWSASGRGADASAQVPQPTPDFSNILWTVSYGTAPHLQTHRVRLRFPAVGISLKPLKAP